MITLHVYLTPKPDQAEALQAAIQTTWISTMSKQLGFVQAAMLTAFEDEGTEEIEIVSYWESEQLRLEWVARPVHDQVFEPIMELAESISSTVKTVGHTWNI